MTRGRDGICIYIPTQQPDKMLVTMKLLQTCGMKELKMEEKGV
jgi:hypothetical protein